MTIADFLTYLKEKNKTHVVFDFDETIALIKVDWDLWNKKMKPLFEEYEGAISQDYVWPLQNELLEKHGAPLRSRLTKMSYEIEKEHRGIVPNNHILEIIKHIPADISIIIWTSNDFRVVEDALTKLGIINEIDNIIGRNDVAFLKPNPHGFSKINIDDSPISSFVMIGNSDADSGAAKAVGMDYFDETEFRE